MLPSLIAIASGLVLLLWSAERFVASASAIAGHYGMPPLLIGMLVIGFGTSAPEMTVSVLSAATGNTGIALGNAYGSNITNIALILGTSAPIFGRIFRDNPSAVPIQFYNKWTLPMSIFLVFLAGLGQLFWWHKMTVERINRVLLKPVALSTAATIAILLFTPFVALLPAGLLAFVLYFFRDPDRSPPDARVVAPADGRISVLREEDDRVRVGVFMNVTDVHVNRAPADGEVVSVTHRPGANKPAFSKDSDRNERVDVDCGDYDLSLVAGWFARRIHPYVTEGDSLQRGERVGHIDFGSRADVLLPPEVDIDDVAVEEGYLTEAEADEVLDPERMTHRGILGDD